MTSEAKIYSLLSKEWKINRYGPWIFHKNVFTVVVQQVRPWSYHMLLHGLCVHAVGEDAITSGYMSRGHHVSL